MADMLETVIPKSDQLNADSLIGGKSLTIKVTGVEIGNGDQPVSIHYEGEQGRPYKACKSMRRVLIQCWGGDGKEYIGRSMTLYCDPEVKFGGVQVGGIRISHLSHIDKPMTVALTTTRAQRKPYTVQPLVVTPAPSLQDALDDISAAPNLDGLKHKYDTAVRTFKTDDERKQIVAAKEKRKTELTITGEES